MAEPEVFICSCCDNPGIEAKADTSPGICEHCYADGWRSGADMDAALKADPVLNVDDEGKVGLREHEVGVPRPPEEKTT